jgi:hypothetical protein
MIILYYGLAFEERKKKNTKKYSVWLSPLDRAVGALFPSVIDFL